MNTPVIKRPPYERFTTVSLQTGLDEICKSVNSGKPAGNGMKATIAGTLVGVSSLRLHTFATKGLVCKHCQIAGSFFAIERNHTLKLDAPYHMNLWSLTVVNGEVKEVLMTHDHIIARALKGQDNIDNSQTMCVTCNGKKAVLEQKILREMRAEMLSLDHMKERYPAYFGMSVAVPA